MADAKPSSAHDLQRLPAGRVAASATNAASPLNLCRACGSDFTSVRLFDAHRIGRHEYSWSRELEDGRRCLDIEEMHERGWEQEQNSRWFDPKHVERARQAFRTPSEPRTVRESGPASPELEESTA
jgi:hypothetical protein